MFLASLLDLPLSSYLLVALSLLLLSFPIRYVLDPLRDIPGPFLARFTRLWYFFKIYEGDFERTDLELHRRYGPVVRTAPGEYSIDDVAAARIIYGHGNAFPKAPWYSTWTPPDKPKANLFGDRDPQHHAIQRRKFSAFYSMSALVGFEPFVNNCISLLSDHFSQFAASGVTVDIQHWLQCYAFDVIGEITFGKRFGLLDQGEDKDAIFKAIDDRTTYGTLTGIFPWLNGVLYPMLPKTGGFAYLVSFSLSQIQQRLRALKDPDSLKREGPPDIAAKLARVHEENPEKMQMGDIASICQSNIGAGSDTTSITLSAILYYLIKYPSTFQKLREEIDAAAKEGRISDPITFKESQSLPYLQAVIKEAIRIHPATGLALVRSVPPSGTTICGRFFPSGSTVGINAWVAHRNSSVFGQDADVWRPERWLEIEEEGRGGDVEKYSLGFGMGSRTCIGKNISLLEMGKLIPQLVRKFDFELDEGLKKNGIKCSNMWFVKQLNFKGRIFLRGEKR